ncbi:hypothetical protein BHM03_00000030 [Ensete ventricosum]|nr:hypothetical protein BHM03_00000030 [Ensete ventricosum]
MIGVSMHFFLKTFARQRELKQRAAGYPDSSPINPLLCVFGSPLRSSSPHSSVREGSPLCLIARNDGGSGILRRSWSLGFFRRSGMGLEGWLLQSRGSFARVMAVVVMRGFLWFVVVLNPLGRVLANMEGKELSRSFVWLLVSGGQGPGAFPNLTVVVLKTSKILRELYSNNISGTIPSDLGNLTNLVSLDLYLNSFTGEIPVSLGKLTKLRFLYDVFPIIELCFTGAIAGGVAAGAALLFAAPAIVFAWWPEEDPEVHLGQLKRFSLRELQVATDNFSNKNILGRGGFGKVYKGRLADGSLVAVKRLKEERTPGGELQFQTEVEMISMAVHRNLLRLRGFCMTPTERLLVYPYMANGSVASRLRAANILLDEDFEAVVGDFGLAKLMDYKDTHVTTAVRGTIGHIAPEYLSTGKSSEKTDVFGFGIMLLELITGQRAFDLARLANDDDVMLLDWVKGLLKEKQLEMLVDPELQNDYVEAEVESLIQVALLCTQGSPTERPKMSEVVRMLEGDGLAERWEEWQKVEVVRQEEMVPRHQTNEWILDSTDNLRPVELSGPR